ncbi:DUF6287 domain-containing protein [Levilactobacillus zymae]|uniref:DUF6287 domain-containing protein n=1 Tax=Levilactobacillus zymae TaxID=267363 RepID=A0A1Y6JWC8_9LACO|nr:DUF6287 domain-containing protein [Levilactobacillus zymae]SMS14239.1 hypothetical protein LZ3411_1189 [Levilactobacillus zymae]
MTLKYLTTIALIGSALGTLTACGSTKKAAPTASSSTSTSRVSSTSQSVKHASTTTTSSATKQHQTTTPAKQVMKFAQIKRGDYRSLTGTWDEVVTGVNQHDETGISYQSVLGTKLDVTANRIRADEVQLAGQTLTADQKNHPLVFKTTAEHALVAQMADAADTAINWTVTFYPKGSSDAFLKEIGWAHSSQNLISFWTSNNSYTQVYAQRPAHPATAAAAPLNVKQIARNDFSSLVGTWRNPINHQTLIVTGKIQARPTGSSAAATQGVVVGGPLQNGHSRVIVTGTIQDGAIQGGLGIFDPQAEGSTFAPLGIVPKGVQLSTDDNSDTARDRLIEGGGQDGYRSQAYYRE